jgi:penicillin amidase
MKTILRILKILKGLVVLLAVLAVVVGVAGYFFVQRTLPQVDGSVQIDGLRDKVEIIRDKNGVPHIYAQNLDDLFFAQGYVHAQDRLWQLEFNRRVAAGRLSEVLGSATVETDTYLRTLGLYRAAQADAAALDPETRAALEAYAKGINAFVASHQDSLPLEFVILGFKPEPWTPADTLGWGKVLAQNLGGNMDAEIWRSRVIARLGAERAADLEPPYPADGPFIVPELGGTSSLTPDEAFQGWAEAGALDDASLAALADRQNALNALLIAADWQQVSRDVVSDEGIGSNNWVVAGSRTESGKPLLANDPHLGIQMPSIWYEIHLTGGGMDVVGASFPGAPAVIIGHNQRIAWGVTNVGPDVQDLFIERMNPQNPKQYQFQGQWVDAQVINEEIKIKGAASRQLEILVTRHGPVVTPILKGVTETLALRWTALDPGAIFRSVRMLNVAKDWNEFRTALSFWDVPSQNFVYADVDGNIGYQTPGRIPIRAKGNGSVPAPGYSGEYEWTGFIPFDELPRVYNPAKGYVVTANNAVVPTSFKYFIGKDWAAPYRAMRIEAGIKAKPKLSIQDMRDIQADVLSIPAQTLAGYLAKLSPADDRGRKAVAALRAWDGKMTVDSVAGTIAEATLVNTMRSTFGDELGDLADGYMSIGVPNMLGLLAQPESVWWDNVNTAQREKRDDILLLGLNQALDEITGRLGSDMAGWQWGKLHTATFAHPLGSVQPLNLIFNSGPHGTPGDGFTPDNNAFNWKTYAQTTVSSYRQIIDLSGFSRSVFQHTTGESGQPFSRHFTDFVPGWIAVAHHPMWYARADVVANQEGTLVLMPR